MTITFAPAHRQQAHIYMAIAGTPGSGKTLSALKIARGIATAGSERAKIAMIETEGNRALDLYACPPNGAETDETFLFDRYALGPPYSSARYQDAILAGQKHVGPGGILIVDSMTFEHTGQGGYLEAHDTEANKMAKGENRTNEAVSFRAWGKVAPDRNKLKFLFTSPNCHLILLFWAKDKNELQDRTDGKKGKTVVNIGPRIIGPQDFLFQMTLAFLMTAETPGEAILERWRWPQAKWPQSLRGVIEDGKMITEDTGRRIADWCAGRERDGPGRRDPTGEIFSVWVGQDDAGGDVTKDFDDIESAARELWSQTAGARDGERIDLLVEKNAKLLARLPKEVAAKLMPHIEKHRAVFAEPKFTQAGAEDDMGMAG